MARKKTDPRIESLAKDYLDGKMGSGLKLKAKLGDDFEAVVKAACQHVPEPKETSVVESDTNKKKTLESVPEEDGKDSESLS